MKKDKTLRKTSLLTAMSLLIMAIIAPFAVFMGLEPNLVQGDDIQTLSNLMMKSNTIGWVGAIFVAIAILDIVISWGVYVIHRSENQPLAVLTGWLRLLYSGVLFMATIPLFMASDAIKGLASNSTTETFARSAEYIGRLIDGFQMTWDVGLILFGLHLITLGILVFRSKQFNRFIGANVVIAGLAYFIDSLFVTLSYEFPITFAEYFFYGEVLLMVWLFYRGFKGFKDINE